MKLFFVTGVLYLLILTLSSGQEATRLIVLSEISTEKLLEIEGDTVRVKGYVESTNTNATGINFLEFKDSEFQCITFARYARKFDKGVPAEIYKEQWLEVTGEIENYRGNPQIKLNSPDQVKIIETPAPPKVTEVKEEVKQTAEATKEDEADKATAAPIIVEPVVKEEEKQKGPELEVVNGVPAIDWRKYFPSAK